VCIARLFVCMSEWRALQKRVKHVARLQSLSLLPSSFSLSSRLVVKVMCTGKAAAAAAAS